MDDLVVGPWCDGHGDAQQGSEAGVPGVTAVESEHELVEVDLEVFAPQAVIDAERPCLRIQRHPQLVMPENLDQIAATTPENVQIARVRIAIQRLLDLHRQAVHATPVMQSSA